MHLSTQCFSLHSTGQLPRLPPEASPSLSTREQCSRNSPAFPHSPLYWITSISIQTCYQFSPLKSKPLTPPGTILYPISWLLFMTFFKVLCSRMPGVSTSFCCSPGLDPYRFPLPPPHWRISCHGSPQHHLWRGPRLSVWASSLHTLILVISSFSCFRYQP